MMEDTKSIFVSYRRDETAAYAGWLADRLGNHFGEQSVFRDIGSIEPGMDFVEAIEHALEGCAVMLVVIGRNWAVALKEHERTGQEDYTRLEVATALKRNIRVIPVLVHGALMPSADELPDDLAALRRRQAIELHDTNWDSDVERAIVALEKIVGRGEEGIRTGDDLEQRISRKVAQGTLRVFREDTSRLSPSSVRDQEELNRLWLFVDGEEVGELSDHQHTDLELDPGPHTVKVRISILIEDWIGHHYGVRDEQLTVGIRSGELTTVLCGQGPGRMRWRTSTYDPFIKQL